MVSRSAGATDIRMISSSQTDHRHQHSACRGTDCRYHHNSVAAEAEDINAASWATWTMNTNMAPGCSPARGHQRGFRQQHKSQASTWLLVVTRERDINTTPSCISTMDTNVGLGGNTNHNHSFFSNMYTAC